MYAVVLHGKGICYSIWKWRGVILQGKGGYYAVWKGCAECWGCMERVWRITRESADH